MSSALSRLVGWFRQRKCGELTKEKVQKEQTTKKEPKKDTKDLFRASLFAFKCHKIFPARKLRLVAVRMVLCRVLHV